MGRSAQVPSECWPLRDWIAYAAQEKLHCCCAPKYIDGAATDGRSSLETTYESSPANTERVLTPSR